MLSSFRIIGLIFFTNYCITGAFAQSMQPGDSLCIHARRMYGEGFVTDFKGTSPYDDSSILQGVSLPSEIVRYRLLVSHSNQHQYYYYEYLCKRKRSDSVMLAWLLKTYPYDTSLLLPRKINEDILVFYGINRDSSKTIIVDVNNNKNLSDDPVIRMPEQWPTESPRKGLPVVEVHNVEYPTKRGVVRQNVLFEVEPYNDIYHGYTSNYNYWRLTLNMHEYREGFFQINNKDFRIRYSPPGGYSFYSRPKSQFLITSMNDSAVNYASHYKYVYTSDTITVDSFRFQPYYLSLLSDTVMVKYWGEDKGDKGVRAGNIARDFRTLDINGRNIVLSGVNTGKYVLLDYWGTWCGPCIAGIYDLVDTYTKIKGTGRFEFISIAWDDGVNLEKMKRVVDSNKMNWIHVFENRQSTGTNSLVGLYKINAFPTGILINPDGKIIEMASGMEEMKRLLGRIVTLSDLFLLQRYS